MDDDKWKVTIGVAATLFFLTMIILWATGVLPPEECRHGGCHSGELPGPNPGVRYDYVGP